MKTILALFFILAPIHVVYSSDYSPIDTANYSYRIKFVKKFVKSQKKYICMMSEPYTLKEKWYIEDILKKNCNAINESILKGDFIFDPRIDSLVTRIVNKLRINNPTIPIGLRFLIAKDNALNATYIGNNTFIINLGTFYFLQNDQQLATIISHEISHLLLDHVAKELKVRCNIEFNLSKQNIKEITKDKNNVGEKAANKFRNILYLLGDMSKRKEIETDSVAFTVYKNANLSYSDFLFTYNLMAQNDSLIPSGVEVDTYHNFFNFSNLPFNEKWLQKDDFTSYDYTKFHEKYNIDSMASHPKFNYRIDYLKKTFPELCLLDSSSSQSSEQFKLINQIAKGEQLPILDYKQEYGNAIYTCLVHLQKNPTDKYYRKWMGKFFLKLHDAKKNYCLNKHLETINPKEQTESYQQFLNFMWNLKLNDLLLIAKHYSEDETVLNKSNGN